MPNNLFSRFGNMFNNQQVNNQQPNYQQSNCQQPNYQQYNNQQSNNYNNNVNTGNNILAQFIKLQKNPGYILDILLQNGKITQQQYNDMYQYRNNPQMIGQYLINSGKGNEINQVQQLLSNTK